MLFVMLCYNGSAYFKDKTGYEINPHQLLHMSSKDNYLFESSQTSQFFGRLNNSPPQKNRRDQSTLRATTPWWKETE